MIVIIHYKNVQFDDSTKDRMVGVDDGIEEEVNQGVVKLHTITLLHMDERN